MVLELQLAVTPPGSPLAEPIPVAPVVAIVISVRAVFIHNVWTDGLSKLYSFTSTPQYPTINIFVPSLLKVIPDGPVSWALTEKFWT